MYLKRIEVKGFKSFADKVEMELNTGITGVVGPNGSGKSNISDAVRWVLGEQSAKTLRGMKMEDIIFAGTSSRKPLGFAEVSITIDNSDNMLPVGYTEIMITRRMYRSGESEYYINRTGCRLRDITELFMDTGVGRDGYSIIGQGRIDEILNAKAEDRREIFEEAAGIVKYRSRKQEAQRKLETTEQNIIRINDIIGELETQLQPLEEQSYRARKYLDLRENLKALEINIFIRNMDKAREKINTLSDSYSVIENNLLDNNRKNARLEEEYDGIRLSIESMDHEIEGCQNWLFKANNDIERLQGEANVLNEKKVSIQKNIERLEEEILAESQDIAQQERTLNENRTNLEELRVLVEQNQLVLEAKDRNLQDINSRIYEKENEIEAMKAEVIELLNSIADKKSSINSLNTFNSSIEKRKAQIAVEEEGKKARRLELEESLKELENNKKECRDKLDDIEKKLSALEISRGDILNRKKAVEKSIYELNDKIHSKQARLKILNEMENDFEGYNRSVKEIMKLKNSSHLSSNICGVVAELIQVPQKYEIAVEAALGSALQNIVTADEFAAKQCIEFLKANKLGRATFLPLTTIHARDNAGIGRLTGGCGGVMGVASSLVKYDDRYKSIIASLLGRVIIVDNMDNGIAAARKTNYSMKIVTLDGDIISPGGAFTGGSISQKTGRILSRKREIDELNAELDMLKTEAAKANDERLASDARLLELENSLSSINSDKHSIQILLSGLNSNYDMAGSDLSRVISDLDSLKREVLQLNEECSEILIKIEEDNAALAELELKSTSLSENVQNEQLGIKDISASKEGLVSEITSIKVKLAELKQEMVSLNDKIQITEQDISKCTEAINNKKNEIAEDNGQIEGLTSSVRGIEVQTEAALKRKDELSQKLDELSGRKRENNGLLSDMEKRKKEYIQLSASLQEELHKIEMQKARLDIEMENLQNRIWEEYEVNYASAQKYKMQTDNMAQVSRDVASIKDEIKELGDVNVGAIDEYRRVKERYEFMGRQGCDLKEAKDSLQQVIDEMTEKMQSQFIKNFAVINENFNTTFQQLFGGGRAELILCNKEDVLSSGIEIVAEPPGKKLQSLTLMSGGEKALTAIALLFGILKMKPSPFCILDEIEAALDDVNVARYAKFLKELSKETQFIIVTHRKGTMEIADVLYGVTMEEKGVSRLVSVKLTEKAS